VASAGVSTAMNQISAKVGTTPGFEARHSCTNEIGTDADPIDSGNLVKFTITAMMAYCPGRFKLGCQARVDAFVIQTPQATPFA
jgi:hypothetical protein